jgi:hypothetical protein
MVVLPVLLCVSVCGTVYALMVFFLLCVFITNALYFGCSVLKLVQEIQYLDDFVDFFRLSRRMAKEFSNYNLSLTFNTTVFSEKEMVDYII